VESHAAAAGESLVLTHHGTPWAGRWYSSTAPARCPAGTLRSTCSRNADGSWSFGLGRAVWRGVTREVLEDLDDDVDVGGREDVVRAGRRVVGIRRLVQAPRIDATIGRELVDDQADEANLLGGVAAGIEELGELLLHGGTVHADERPDEEPESTTRLHRKGEVDWPDGPEHPFELGEVALGELLVAAQPLEREAVLVLPQVRGGLGDSSATVLQTLTSDMDLVRAAIDRVGASGGTNIGAGVVGAPGGLGSEGATGGDGRRSLAFRARHRSPWSPCPRANFDLEDGWLGGVPRAIGRDSAQSGHLNDTLADLQSRWGRGEPVGLDVRVNQRQAANGEQLGINRPDLQFDYDGRRISVEWDRPLCADTSRSRRGSGHADRLYANNPNGNVQTVIGRASGSLLDHIEPGVTIVLILLGNVCD